MKKLSKHHKKIIYILFFWTGIGILFLAVAALLVLWASGYKYNFLAHKFQKTGIIYLTSEPRNVKIYIDKKLVKERTPAKIGYILPGKYLVEIKKNDYQNWSQEIEVEAGKVKRFDNIILFYQNPKYKEISQNVQSFYTSPDNNKILFQSDKFYIYDIKTANSSPIETPNLEYISWSSNSQKILFKDQNSISPKGSLWLYGLSNSTITPINLPNLQNYTKILWQKNNDEKFYILKDGALYLNDINGNSNILTSGVIDFDLGNNNIYFTMLSDNKEILKKSDLNFKNPEDILTFTDFHWQIIVKDPYLFVKNSKNDFYQLVQNNLDEINSNVQLYSWSEDISFWGLVKKIRLLYKTSLDDIYTFDPESGYNNFIYRTLKPIEKTEWYPDLNHIVFQSNSEIKIIEIDGKNEITLAGAKNFELLSDEKIVILDLNGVLKILQIKG